MATDIELVKAEQADVALAGRALIGRQFGARRLSDADQAARETLRDRLQLLKRSAQGG